MATDKNGNELAVGDTVLLQVPLTIAGIIEEREVVFVDAFGSATITCHSSAVVKVPSKGKASVRALKGE